MRLQAQFSGLCKAKWTSGSAAESLDSSGSVDLNCKRRSLVQLVSD